MIGGVGVAVPSLSADHLDRIQCAVRNMTWIVYDVCITEGELHGFRQGVKLEVE